MVQKLKIFLRKYYHNNLVNHFINFLSVILGVYLAFYINERAQINRDVKESVILMNSLIEELSEDISTYEEYQIPINEQILKKVERVVLLLSQDSIMYKQEQLALIMQVENYFPSSSTYNSMKVTGKIQLMNDLSLQKEMSLYYEGLVIECIKKGELQANYFIDEIVTWMTNNVDLLEMKVIKEDELFTLRNKLIIYSTLINQKVQNYKTVVAKSKQLKANIQNKVHSM